jgi:hypothetical protein
MQYTAEGFYSEIVYQKTDGSPPTTRIVEPREIGEGASGMLVLCVQIQPKASPTALRSFKADCIQKVSRAAIQIPAVRLSSNQFATGEIKSRYRGRRVSDGFRIMPASRTSQEPARMFQDPGLSAYLQTVRNAILDFQVTAEEVNKLQRVRYDLRLSEDQMRAAHACVLGEELLAVSVDGEFLEEDRLYLILVNKCLGECGWAPLNP